MSSSFISTNFPVRKYEYKISKEEKKNLSDEDIKALEMTISTIYKESKLTDGKYVLTSAGVIDKTTQESAGDPTKTVKTIKDLTGKTKTLKLENLTVEFVVSVPSKTEVILQETLDTERSFYKGIKELGKAYREDRVNFINHLKKKGFSDYEIHRVFSAFAKAEEQSAIFEKELSTINHMIQSGKKSEALERFSRFMNANFPAYAKEMGEFTKLITFVGELDKSKGRLTAALASYLGKDSSFVKSQLGINGIVIMPVQRPPRYGLLLKEISKEEDLPSLKSAQTTVEKSAMEVNEQQRKYENQQAALTKTFEPTLIASKASWLQELRKNKEWKRGDEKEFFSLLNDYGKALAPLTEAYEDYRNNRTSLAYRIHLREVATKQLPILNKLNVRFGKINGKKKADILSAALQASALSPEEKVSLDIGAMMKDRIIFADKLYTNRELGLDNGAFLRAFDTMEKANGAIFRQALKENGLTKGDIAKLNGFHAQILEQRERLLKASHEAHGDQRNEKYKKESAQIKKNLEKIENDFKKWGGMQKLKKFEDALFQMGKALLKENETEKNPEFRKRNVEAIEEIAHFSFIDDMGVAARLFNVLGAKAPLSSLRRRPRT